MRPSVDRLHLPAAIIVVIALAHVSMHWGYTVDDAYITYRYSRSLADGLGLTFNPGEWTKGYSSTLYALTPP